MEEYLHNYKGIVKGRGLPPRNLMEFEYFDPVRAPRRWTRRFWVSTLEDTRAAYDVDRILKGAKPADLPSECCPSHPLVPTFIGANRLAVRRPADSMS